MYTTNDEDNGDSVDDENEVDDQDKVVEGVYNEENIEMIIIIILYVTQLKQLWSLIVGIVCIFVEVSCYKTYLSDKKSEKKERIIY